MARRGAIILGILVLLGISIPGTAAASQKVRLKASFSPDHLGGSTTISLAFDIFSTTGGLPSPVTDVQIDLPAGMGLGTTDLGEETCDPSTLFELGPSGCSPNSRMGLGNAMVEIPVGNAPKFHANVTVYMGKPVNHHTTMLIYAETVTPVYGQFVFPSELLPVTSGAYGAQLNTAMPLIPTWPGGPPAVIVHMETTLGPRHLTYYTRKHGKLVGYRPEGMAVPERCPRGGFAFRANYHFQDGTSTSATTSVPCPRAASRAPAGARHRR